ncbi:MAG: hypothetical protein LUD71_05165 [Clostridiales bacterium]|nr:hypothetical protein [Clostridiales bacterium]
MEILRENTQGGVGIFTTAQMFSFVFAGAAILLFLRNRRSRNAEDYDYKEKVYSIWL